MGIIPHTREEVEENNAELASKESTPEAPAEQENLSTERLLEHTLPQETVKVSTPPLRKSEDPLYSQGTGVSKTIPKAPTSSTLSQMGQLEEKPLIIPLPPVIPQASKKTKDTAIEKTDVYGMFLLEDLFPHTARHLVLRLLGIVLMVCFVAIILSVILSVTEIPGISLSKTLLRSIAQKASGLFFIVFSFWAFAYVLEAFYRSLYYHNREHRAKVSGKRNHVVSEVIEYFYDTPDGDILGAFLRSSVGAVTLARLGIQENDRLQFLENRTDVRTISFYEIEKEGVITREDLGWYLYQKYDEFSKFLFRYNISKEVFKGALVWMIELDLGIKFKERWWSKDRLEKIAGFGGAWSYGKAYTLARYGHDISGHLGDETTSDFLMRRLKYVNEIETILSKKGEANALLIGENGVGTMDIVRDIARRVATGKTTPELMDRRLVLLDTDFLISTTGDKNNFELEFMKVLSDAAGAGNVTLVFDNFAGFLASAHAEGSDGLSLLNKYLESPSLQVIALSDKEKYHQFLETNSLITTRFEVVVMEEPEYENVIGILEDQVLSLEYQYGIFFTYPSLLEIAKSAKYYITEGVMPDKALDLLNQIAPRAREQKESVISTAYIQEFVSIKTHIPMGKIGEAETDQLEHLEGSLHQLVIGQEKAIDALSNALRRSRAGLRDLEKPVGSFLFLGPTGVGKTQTAKAIAEVYFGDGTALSRIDMSEYQSPDALERLIGAFDSGKVGTLTTIVKSRPYGVLLLDELEKANRDVHDLFLQILDEGFFSDMGGRKVNTRNLIFIATSNAGSDIIFQAAESGRDVSEMKDELVNYVISNGIYRPEFLNRFDDVIVFHPLLREQIREVAKIMLTETKKRIKGQGYELVINEPLIDYTVEQGYDPAFGARPMERAIKDTVEEVIAKRIISGTVHPGDTITLSEEDFKNEHMHEDTQKNAKTPLSY